MANKGKRKNKNNRSNKKQPQSASKSETNQQQQDNTQNQEQTNDNELDNNHDHNSSQVEKPQQVKQEHQMQELKKESYKIETKQQQLLSETVSELNDKKLNESSSSQKNQPNIQKVNHNIPEPHPKHEQLIKTTTNHQSPNPNPTHQPLQQINQSAILIVMEQQQQSQIDIDIVVQPQQQQRQQEYPETVIASTPQGQETGPAQVQQYAVELQLPKLQQTQSIIQQQPQQQQQQAPNAFAPSHHANHNYSQQPPIIIPSHFHHQQQLSKPNQQQQQHVQSSVINQQQEKQPYPTNLEQLQQQSSKQQQQQVIVIEDDNDNYDNHNNNKLFHPICQTLGNQSLVMTSIVTREIETYQNDVKEERETREEQQQNEGLLGSNQQIGVKPQLNLQKNQSFINMLRQSRLQSQPGHLSFEISQYTKSYQNQHNTIQSHPQIKPPPQQQARITQAHHNQNISNSLASQQQTQQLAITHSIIPHQQQVSLLLPPSKLSSSVMKFIVVNTTSSGNNKQQQQQSQQQQQKGYQQQNNGNYLIEQQQKRHLIRDQTQQRLASEEEVRIQQQNQQNAYKLKHESDSNEIVVFQIEKQLNHATNDIQMAKILSNYQSSILSSTQPVILQAQSSPLQLQKQSQPNQPQQHQNQKPSISSSQQQKQISSTHQQSLHTNNSSNEHDTSTTTTTKVQQIKMFFERNSKIVEEIDYDQEEKEGNNNPIQEQQQQYQIQEQLQVSAKHIQQRAINPLLIETIQKIHEKQSFANDKNQQKAQSSPDPSHNNLPQQTHTPNKHHPQQQPSQQIDFSSYQLTSQLDNSPSHHQQILYVSKQYQDQIDHNQDQQSLSKQQSSPVLFKLRASQVNSNKNNDSHDVNASDEIINVREQDIVPVRERGEFGLKVYQMKQSENTDDNRYYDDDLHDPCNSPVELEIQNRGFRQLHQQENEFKLTIHHLGGKHHPTQQKNAAFETNPASIVWQDTNQTNHNNHAHNHQHHLSTQELTSELQHITLHPIHPLHPSHHPHQFTHSHSLTHPTSIHPTQDNSSSIEDTGILNKLEQVCSEHMITEKNIDVSTVVQEDQIGEDKNSKNSGMQKLVEVSQVEALRSYCQKDKKQMNGEFKTMQNQFLKKIIPEQFYLPELTNNSNNHLQQKKQQLTKNVNSQQYITIPQQVLKKNSKLIKPNQKQLAQTSQNPSIILQVAIQQKTPQRPSQPAQPQVIHSIVREWNPHLPLNNDFNHQQYQLKQQKQQYHHHQEPYPQSYHPSSHPNPPPSSHPHYQQQQLTPSFQSPQRNNLNTKNAPQLSQQQQWKHTHRDTIIDALNDLDNNVDSQQQRRQIQEEFYNNDRQYSSSRSPIYQPSQFSINDQLPLTRTLTPQNELNHHHTVNNNTNLNNHSTTFSFNNNNLHHNTSSMPFLLNSRPSDKYRQFIDDHSAHKQVEQSRTFGGNDYLVGGGRKDDYEELGIKNNQNRMIVNQNDSANKPNNPPIYPSTHHQPHQPILPSSQPKVYTMQQYKKRYQSSSSSITYSFTKPKTNIISLDSLQKNVVTHGEDVRKQQQDMRLNNGQIVRVQIQERIVTGVINEEKKDAVEIIKPVKIVHTQQEITHLQQINLPIIITQNEHESTNLRPPLQQQQQTITPSRHQQQQTHPSSSSLTFSNNPPPSSSTNHTFSIKPTSQTSISPPTIVPNNHLPSTYYLNNNKPASYLERFALAQQPPREQTTKFVVRKEETRAGEQLSKQGNKEKSISDQSLIIDEVITIGQNVDNDQVQNELTDNQQQQEIVHESVQVMEHKPTDHLQFFTSYSSTTPQQVSNNLALQQRPTLPPVPSNYPSTISPTPTNLPHHPTPSQLHPSPPSTSSPIITIPTFTFTTPFIKHNQSPEINQNNICADKFLRSREKSREKSRGIVINSAIFVQNHFNDEKKLVDESCEKSQYRSYEPLSILGQREVITKKQEDHHKFYRVPQGKQSSSIYHHPVFTQYANYNHSKDTTPIHFPKNQTTLHHSPANQPSALQSHYPFTKFQPYQQTNTTFQTGLKGNTNNNNSGTKSRHSQHTFSPSYLNNVYTPQYKPNNNNNNISSQPYYHHSMINYHPSKQDDNYLQSRFNDSRQLNNNSKDMQLLRLNDSRDSKRPISKGKKQKICLTLRRDHIKKENGQVDENSYYNKNRGQSNDFKTNINTNTSQYKKPHWEIVEKQLSAKLQTKKQNNDQQRDNIRPKLKQVKLSKQQPKEEQLSPNLLTKEYKEKKFMKIQKFSSQSQKDNPQKHKQIYENNRRQLIREDPDPSINLNFTELFSFLDKPEDNKKQHPTQIKQFRLIEQQKNQQISLKKNPKAPFILQKPQFSSKPSTTSKLLAIGKKPQQTFKTEYNNIKQPIKHSEGYQQTGYKILDHQPLIFNEFKGFVRSKLITEGEKQIKREINKNSNNNLDDSLSDVENEDIPMLSH